MVVVILVLFAILEFIGGISVFGTAKSAIHEILGTLAVGFSILTLGLAAILYEVGQSRKVFQKVCAALPTASSKDPQRYKR
jgi:hypothetical protein